jgi:hypothetical protein
VKLPRHLLRHALVVEPYHGNSGNGPVYGPAITVPCHLVAKQSTKRQREGRAVDDASTAWCQLDAADLLTPEARVTYAGRLVEVVSVTRHELPRGPAPNHLEVTFI